ncbi:RING finger protein [Candidatus Dependentiae bacterium]
MKKILTLTTAAVLLTCPFGWASVRDDNADENYMLTEAQTRARAKETIRTRCVQKKGRYTDVYDDSQAKYDAENLSQAIEDRTITDPRNFKRITEKRFHPQRVETNTENAIWSELRTLIKKRVQQRHPDHARMAAAIASTIMRDYRSGAERQFIGKNLNRKIDAEIAKQTRRINKYYPKDKCCVCRKRFDEIGTRYFMAPCGHDICPACATRWQKECSDKGNPITCPHCSAKVESYERQTVAPSPYNPETRR